MPFSTPLIFCSSGVATEASTSVALAPMKVVVTWTIGGTISGYCAIGRPCIATRPSITMMIDITIATMGRLTKKRAMATSPRQRLRFAARLGCARFRGLGRRRLGHDGHAVLNPLQAFRHDALTRLDAFLDHPQRADALADLHGAKRDLVARIDHGHAVDALQFLDGSLRNQQRARIRVEQQPGPAVLAGPQQTIRVGKRELHAQRAGGGIDGAFDQVDACRCAQYRLPSASVSWMSVPRGASPARARLDVWR